MGSRRAKERGIAAQDPQLQVGIYPHPANHATLTFTAPAGLVVTQPSFYPGVIADNSKGAVSSHLGGEAL